MEIRIHELLNGYEDCSVPMDEMNVVSMMKIKELTKMKIEQSETQYKPRHTVRKRILTLALAAALILSLGIAAYSAGQAVFGWGGNMEVRAEKTDGGIETTVYVHTDNLTEPVSFENGRMYFIVNGEHLDITDRISETKPYIYQFTDEEGVLHYWIIGKNGPELEHYGYAEYLHPSEEDWTAGYVARTNGNTALWLDKAKEELGFDF
ncbi:MAG: hypothetical protein IJV40_12385 [Oscillospiraceae bacterium]|nr:hypothetical protein [Oscillospiraceae bacterium]